MASALRSRLFRSSIPCRPVPLATLRWRPCGPRRRPKPTMGSRGSSSCPLAELNRRQALHHPREDLPKGLHAAYPIECRAIPPRRSTPGQGSRTASTNRPPPHDAAFRARTLEVPTNSSRKQVVGGAWPADFVRVGGLTYRVGIVMEPLDGQHPVQPSLQRWFAAGGNSVVAILHRPLPLALAFVRRITQCSVTVTTRCPSIDGQRRYYGRGDGF